MRPLVLLTLAYALAASGCTRAPSDATPAGAARLFVSAMERSAGDRHGLEDAYHLLSQGTRERLVERARQTASLGARERDPWEMLVEGTAHLRFEPRPGGFREQPHESDADHASVLVVGAHEDETATIQVVLEDEGWRVELEVPDARPGE